MQDMTTKNRLSRFFASVHHPGSVLNLRSIRREVLPYFIGWIAVFTWLYSCFLPGGNLLFLPTNQLTGYEQIMTYIWLIACPLITLGFEGIHYVPKTIYSAISALLAFIGIVFLTIGPAAILFHILCAIALGHAFASFAYGFFMILNNVERFFSMIFGVLFPKLLLSLSPLLRQFLVGLSVQEFIYLCCLLLIFGCAVAIAKDPALIPHVTKKKFSFKAYSLMPVVFIMLSLC
ncbi:MAG: hypothetical protein RR661_05160, partial [Anaerovoracaceae bacterium]